MEGDRNTDTVGGFRAGIRNRGDQLTAGQPATGLFSGLEYKVDG